MDRDQEMQHLAEAVRHIQQSNKRIADLEDSIARCVARGEDVSCSRATLATWRDVLATFLEHRDQIVRTLGEIDAGRYLRP